MLKKLFVHEWKACWRLMALVNGLVLAISLLGILVFRNDFWNTMNTNGSPILGIAFTLYFLVYMVSIGALSFVVSLYFYVRFFNNLYTDQGYLMHTLPVKPAHLIWSKAFVGVIWQFISGLVIVFSVMSVLFSILIGNGVNWQKDVWDEIWRELTNSGKLWEVVVTLLLTLVMAVVASFMSIFLGYTAISIGQLCKKQKILGAIGAYIGIYLILQIAGAFATIPMTAFFDRMNSLDPGIVQMAGPMGVSIVAFALVTAGLYFVNEYIMKFKLNLE